MWTNRQESYRQILVEQIYNLLFFWCFFHSVSAYGYLSDKPDQISQIDLVFILLTLNN